MQNKELVDFIFNPKFKVAYLVILCRIETNFFKALYCRLGKKKVDSTPNHVMQLEIPGHFPFKQNKELIGVTSVRHINSLLQFYNDHTNNFRI